MVQAARYAGNGVLPARRRQQPRNSRSEASADCCRDGRSTAAVALSWVIRSGNDIAIPEAGVPAHVTENAVALSLALTPQELQALDA